MSEHVQKTHLNVVEPLLFHLGGSDDAIHFDPRKKLCQRARTGSWYVTLQLAKAQERANPRIASHDMCIAPRVMAKGYLQACSGTTIM